MAFSQQRLPNTHKSFTVKGGTVKVGDRRAGFIKCLTPKFNNALAFISPRKRKQHFFRIYGGYGLNSDLLQYLRERKINHILIIEDKTRFLLSKVDDWLLYGCNVDHTNYEPQLVLMEDKMKETENCL